VLEVWNPGPAIPPEELLRLFDRFIGEVNRKNNARMGTWIGFANELPNNTEGRRGLERIQGQGHLFVSICQ